MAAIFKALPELFSSTRSSFFCFIPKPRLLLSISKLVSLFASHDSETLSRTNGSC